MQYMGRWIKFLCALLIAQSLGGCVVASSPTSSGVAVGLFKCSMEKPRQEVTYSKVEGMGILFENGGISIGHIRREWTAIHVAGSNFTVQTPQVWVAVGLSADHQAFEFGRKSEESVIKLQE